MPLEEKERSGQTGGAAENLVALAPEQPGNSGLEQLPRHGVRQVLLQLGGSGPKHAKAPTPGGDDHLGDQARLADSGVALDKHDLPAGRRRCRQRALEHGQLHLPFEQDPRKCANRGEGA